MSQEAEIPDIEIAAKTPAAADKATNLRNRAPEDVDTLSVDTKRAKTRIALETARISLLEKHTRWINEDPHKVGFDHNMIQVAMIEDLLASGRTNLARLAAQLMDGNGCYLSREKMEEARDKVKRMLEKGN